MPVVPGYRHDIFVSYAHDDDALLLEDAKEGWVTSFVDLLGKKLSQEFERKERFDVYWDYELPGNRIVDTLLDELSSSAILLVVMSKAYLLSDWCEREKNAFLDKVRQERLREDSRIFLVERGNVRPEERPPEFRDLKGCSFWAKAGEGSRERVLCEAGVRSVDQDYLLYFQRLDRLTRELAGELNRLRLDAQGAGTRPDERPCVFLAEVTDDLYRRREEVARYLDQSGIRVLPEKWYEREPQAYRAAMESDLAKCKVFVQLVSDLPGIWPNLPQGSARFQFQIAKDAGKRVLQWRDPLINVAEVAEVDRIAAELLQAETVRAESIEDFKAMAKRWASEKADEGGDEEPVSAFVFVDSDPSDRALAKELFRELQNCDVDVTMAVGAGEPEKIRKELEDNLEYCNALIVVYGSSDPLWVKEQLMQSRKSLYKRDRPLSALAVYQGPPPEDKEDLGIAIRDLQVLDCRDGLNQVKLRDFLGCVRGKGNS